MTGRVRTMTTMACSGQALAAVARPVDRRVRGLDLTHSPLTMRFMPYYCPEVVLVALATARLSLRSLPSIFGGGHVDHG